jgi:hypothetical protein
MAYAPIAYTIPQYDPDLYANWWLKAYTQGTTTPLVMALDSAGSTTVAKLELDTNGFPNTVGGALTIPYIDGAYDLWLFPTEAEADANDTSNAKQFADNINAEGGSSNIVKSNIGDYTDYGCLTVSDMANHLSRDGLTVFDFKVGEIVETDEYSSGNGGGAKYKVTTVGTTPNVDLPNGFNIIVSTVDATKCFVLRAGDGINIRSCGASDSASGSDNVAAINAATLYAQFSGVGTYDTGGAYDIDGQINVYRDSNFIMSGPATTVFTDVTAATSDPAFIVGTAADRQVANGGGVQGWTFGNFRLTGNSDRDAGIYASNVQADNMLPVHVDGYLKTGAKAVILSGNPNYYLGETNPNPTITGAFYNSFNGWYVRNNYYGLTLSGVANEGQANTVYLNSCNIRANVRNLFVEISNHINWVSGSCEALTITEYGVELGTNASGIYIGQGVRCEDSSAAFKDWILDNSTMSNLELRYEPFMPNFDSGTYPLRPVRDAAWSRSTTTLTITHNLGVSSIREGQRILLWDSSDATFDGVHEITSVVDTNSIEVTVADSGGASGTANFCEGGAFPWGKSSIGVYRMLNSFGVTAPTALIQDFYPRPGQGNVNFNGGPDQTYEFPHFKLTPSSAWNFTSLTDGMMRYDTTSGLSVYHNGGTRAIARLVSVPTASSDSGEDGDYAIDGTYIYFYRTNIISAGNGWTRTAHSGATW